MNSHRPIKLNIRFLMNFNVSWFVTRRGNEGALHLYFDLKFDIPAFTIANFKDYYYLGNLWEKEHSMSTGIKQKSDGVGYGALEINTRYCMAAF